MKKIPHLLLALFIAFTMLQPAPAIAAGEVIDQSCEPSGEGTMYATTIFDMPMGQSFIPTKSPLAGVEVYLKTVNAYGDDTITLNLRQGSITGNILTSSTQTVAGSIMNWEGLVYFAFPSAQTVTPGDVYVWELVVTNPTFAYYATTATDLYAGGNLFTAGSPRVNQDAYFRTYTYPDPSAPSITVQPADQQALEGQTVLLTAAATGFPVPSVQWERSTDGVVFIPIDGAISPTYSFIAGVADNNTQYRAVFVNDSDSAVTSTATLQVTPMMYNKYYQKIYSSTPLTWTQAKRAASALKVKVGNVTYIGHLATITSDVENTYINSLLGSDQAFIGATKTRKGWTWISGETWDTTYWDPLEPSGDDSYVKSVSGLWDAVAKSDTLSVFLVEYEVKGTRY